MAADAKPPRTAEERTADDARLQELAGALADAIDAAVPGWIERLVRDRVAAWHGAVGPEAEDRAREAAGRARREVSPKVRDLLLSDVDDQRTNPLALLRRATRHAHDALEELGVPAVARDEFSERSFPEDRYDLNPARWDDIDPSLQDLGLSWGAAKAYVFKARRRDEGRR